MSSDKAYLRLEVGKELKNQFKAQCVLSDTTMNRKAVELIQEWLEKEAKKQK